jgi:tetratricopeptide (TPR) repeat protein
MRTWISSLLMAFAFASGSAAWAVGSPTPSGGDISSPRTQSAEQKARAMYESGVRAVKKADKYAANPKKADRATDQYARARDLFESAVTENPQMHEAWNYLGYARRKLGSFESAITAYDRALALKPDYLEAIEYRGEAYLGLNRIEDAKNAYLELFAHDRKLAETLLTAMKKWAQAQRGAGSPDIEALNALDEWLQERSVIAAQVTALTRERSSHVWR